MKRKLITVVVTAALALSGEALAADPPAAPAGNPSAVPAANPPPAPAAAQAEGTKAGEPAGSAPSKGAEVSASRRLFDAGARAYSAGNYRAAIQAFEQAYALEARPGLLFSIAQAHRRQYKVDGRPGHVAVAIRRYQEYLVQLKTGGRRADAEAALAELQPIAQKLEQDGQLLPLSSQETERATRLIVTSSAPGATILLDGDATPHQAPLIVELTAGRHEIRVSAKNHVDERREIEVASGAVTALDLPLREKPAALDVTTVAGARVSVDGRLVGEAPLAGPVELPSGPHDIQVQRSGYMSYSSKISVGPGEKLTLSAPLALTLQRRVSIGLVIGGGAALAGGAVLGGLALAQQAEAGAIQGKMSRGEVVCREQACPDLDRYNGALAARDSLRAGAFTLAGAGVVAAGAGLFFYVFDGALPFSGASDSRGSKPASAAGETRIRVAGVPIVGPGLGGVAISGQF